MLGGIVLAVLFIASFILSYIFDQESLLPEEGIDEVPEQTTGVTGPDGSLQPCGIIRWTGPLVLYPAPSICLGSSAPACCRLIRFI